MYEKPFHVVLGFLRGLTVDGRGESDEMRRLLHLAHGLVEDILDDVVNVGTAKALGRGAE